MGGNLVIEFGFCLNVFMEILYFLKVYVKNILFILMVYNYSSHD